MPQAMGMAQHVTLSQIYEFGDATLQFQTQKRIWAQTKSSMIFFFVKEKTWKFNNFTDFIMIPGVKTEFLVVFLGLKCNFSKIWERSKF